MCSIVLTGLCATLQGCKKDNWHNWPSPLATILEIGYQPGPQLERRFVEYQSKRLLKQVQFKAASTTLITTASAVLANPDADLKGDYKGSHGKVDAAVNEAQEILMSETEGSNALVKKAYLHLYSALKNLSTVNIDKASFKNYQYAINEGHEKVLVLLEMGTGLESSIDRKAAELCSYVDQTYGYYQHGQHACATGIALIIQMVDFGRGRIGDAADYVEMLHLVPHSMSGSQLHSLDIRKIERDIQYEFRKAVDWAEERFRIIQEQAEDFEKTRVDFIQNAPPPQNPYVWPITV